MNIDEIETELLRHLKFIDSFLNEKDLRWKEVRGALNIVKNKNRENYNKIKNKLFMDYRMIEDHQITVDAELSLHMDEAWKIAESLEQQKI